MPSFDRPVAPSPSVSMVAFVALVVAMAAALVLVILEKTLSPEGALGKRVVFLEETASAESKKTAVLDKKVAVLESNVSSSGTLSKSIAEVAENVSPNGD